MFTLGYRKTTHTMILIVILFSGISFINCGNQQKTETQKDHSLFIDLVDPVLDSKHSLEKAINLRRSVRNYNNKNISIEEISQILWSAQGITQERRSLRTTPSAGALYPLTVYLYAERINDLQKGIYEYIPQEHKLKLIKTGDYLSLFQESGFGQSCLLNPAAIVIIAGDLDIITPRYRDRALMYTHIEVGHVGQNIHLQAIPLGIGTVVVGALRESMVEDLLGFEKNQKVFTIMPLGKVE